MLVLDFFGLLLYFWIFFSLFGALERFLDDKSENCKKLRKNIIKSTVTVCPRSSDPFYIVSDYIKLVTTFWTDSVSEFHWKLVKHIFMANYNSSPENKK